MRKFLLKIYVLGIAVFGISHYAQAQIDIQPFVGWQIGGNMRFVEGEMNVKSDMNYGVVVDVGIHDGIMLELYYSQMSTTADWRPYRGYENWWPATTIAMDIHYLQIGGIKYLERGNIEPFGAFTIGAAWFEGYENVDKTGGTDTVERFAITLGGGVKIMPSDRIGLRLEARLLMPLYFAGIGLWAGTGGGGVSVGAGVPLLQADLTAGLVIRLGE